MTDTEHVEVPRAVVQRVRDYIAAATDEAGTLSALELDTILVALDWALA